MSSVLVASIFIGAASAETENSSVDVEVEETVQLDVKPNQLNYGVEGDGLDVGTQTAQSDDGFEQIEIANIGSDRLDLIYAESEMPTSQPFATESGTQDHNTGNFAVISLETVNNEGYDIGGIRTGDTNEEFHFLNRAEYFEENPPTYLEIAEDTDELDNLATDPVESEVGQFRVQDSNYWFAYYEDDGGDQVLKVANTPETEDSLGTFDFTESGDDYTEYIPGDFDSEPDTDADLLTGQSLAVPTNDYDASADGPLLDDGSLNGDNEEFVESERNYNLWIDAETEDVIVRTRFNVNQDSPEGDWSPEVNTDGPVDYILDAESTESDALQPGENFPVDFGVELPNGVDASSISEGSVTFNAEAFQ